MAGIFQEGLERAPGPEILETAEQKQAVQWIMSKLQGLGGVTIPTQQIPGLIPTEQISQQNLLRLIESEQMPAGYEMGITELQKTLQGRQAYQPGAPYQPTAYQPGAPYEERFPAPGFQDPRTSLLYTGLRQELEKVKEEGLSDIARQAQMGGMLYSSPRLRAQAEFVGDIARTQISELGRLFEVERGIQRRGEETEEARRFAAYQTEIGQAYGWGGMQVGMAEGARQSELGRIFAGQEAQAGRQYGAIPMALQYGQYAQQQPYQQLAAAQQYGALPREIAGAQAGARYQQQMQQVMFPYQQGGQLSQMLTQYSPYYQPQYYPTQSPWSQVMGPVTDIATLYAAGKKARA